jgi:hypothetical protein
MKLGGAGEFWVLRKAGTEEYYSGPATTTLDILEARRFTDREKVDTFRAEVEQKGISIEGKTPGSKIIRIRIATEQSL